MKITATLLPSFQKTIMNQKSLWTISKPMMLNGKMLLKSGILAKRHKSISIEHMKRAKTKKAIGLYGCIPVLRIRMKKIEGARR